MNTASIYIKTRPEIKAKSENPTKYLLESIKIARRERKEGRASPIFDNADDAIKWLNS